MHDDDLKYSRKISAEIFRKLKKSNRIIQDLILDYSFEDFNNAARNRNLIRIVSGHALKDYLSLSKFFVSILKQSLDLSLLTIEEDKASYKKEIEEDQRKAKDANLGENPFSDTRSYYLLDGALMDEEATKKRNKKIREMTINKEDA